MDVVFGVLQDGTEDQGYERVLIFAIAVKAWAFVLALGYIYIDYRHLSRGMTMTRKQRLARESQITDPAHDPLTRREVKQWVNVVTFGLLGAMVVTAWTLFCVYLIVD